MTPRTWCYFCGADITDAVQVTLGETAPAFACVCCTACATLPFPLFEVSRTRANPDAHLGAVEGADA